MREDEADMARTALITGATGGLGGAVVERFAADGWSVLGVDKRVGDDRENVRFVEADLFDAEQVEHAVAQAGTSCARSSTSSAASPRAAACTRRRSRSSSASSR